MRYRDALLLAINKWNKNPIEDEWLFETFRQEMISRMSPVEAFDSINETIDILLQEADESTAIEILQTVIGLAQRSETTEIPDIVLVKKVEIQLKFEEFGDYAKNKLVEFFRYYRL